MQTQPDIRILVADPDNSLAAQLEEQGYEVTSVKGGTSALERGAARPFNIFLISYSLSDLNGGIVADNLAQYSWKTRPLIILYSREPNTFLKKHSHSEFAADLYFEGVNVENIPEFISKKLSGVEVKSRFVDDEPTVASKVVKREVVADLNEEFLFPIEPEVELPQELDSIYSNNREPLQTNSINYGEVNILSKELEIAHRELNEVTIKLIETSKKVDEIKMERDRMREEREHFKSLVNNAKRNVEEDLLISKSQLAEANRKIQQLENQNRETLKNYERMRERAKEDLKKLKEREERFAAQILETKRDAENLMRTRDQKIYALKKEFEELQFELERRGEKLQLSKERIEYWKHRVGKVTRALRVAMNVLEGEEGGQIV